MPHADLNGQTIYYDVYGEGEPLLCIHGLSINRRGWVLQIAPWSEAHKLVVFDNRDVGESSYAESEYETTDLAQDALALADHLELDTFHLLGISLGGMAAQHVALAAPERVRSLTIALSQPGSGAYGRLRGENLATTAQKLSREERTDQLMLLCYTEAFFENQAAVDFLRNAILAEPHPQSPDAFARQARAGARHDVRSRLAGLEMPVHVIGAERDLLIPVWKSEQIAELIPGSELTILEGVGHGAPWEAAEQFNQVVLDFLARSRAEAVR